MNQTNITEEILEKNGFEKSENNLNTYQDVSCFYRYKTDNYKIYIIVFKVQDKWKCECGNFFGEIETHPLVAENEVKIVVNYMEDIQRCIDLTGIGITLNK